MTENLKNALNDLKINKRRLVMIGPQTHLSSDTPGVFSLLDYITDGEFDFSDFSAADKVIGRGAALLYAKMKIKEVYALVMSEKAKEIFELYNIPCYYDTLVPFIINRKGDGMCPVEKATENITDIQEAFQIIKETVNYRPSKSAYTSVPVFKRKGENEQ